MGDPRGFLCDRNLWEDSVYILTMGDTLAND
jgi:hypothetical protein